MTNTAYLSSVDVANQAKTKPLYWRWDEGAVRGSQPTLPSGKHTKNYGKSLFLMGKLTISMAIFNSYVKSPEGSGFRQIYGDFSHDSKQQKGDVHQEFLWNSRNRNGNFSHKELSHRNGKWMESTNRNGELGFNWQKWEQKWMEHEALDTRKSCFKTSDPPKKCWTNRHSNFFHSSQVGIFQPTKGFTNKKMVLFHRSQWPTEKQWWEWFGSSEEYWAVWSLMVFG